MLYVILYLCVSVLMLTWYVNWNKKNKTDLFQPLQLVFSLLWPVTIPFVLGAWVVANAYDLNKGK